MKKGIILTVLACMMLSGCSVTMVSEGTKSTSGTANVSTGYFERYSILSGGTVGN